MLIKLIIVSIILVAIVMLALGVKLLFDKNAEFKSHSCALNDDEHPANETCAKCQLKDFAQCTEKQDEKNKKDPKDNKLPSHKSL